MAKDFIGLVKTSKTPHQSPMNMFNFILKDSFSFEGLVSIGAIAQIALVTVLPFRVAVLPAALFVIYTVITTAMQLPSIKDSKYMEGVLTQRTSAQLPHTHNGRFGSEPGAQPVVVFHFGVRFNHPLGIFSPGARETVAHFNKCNEMAVSKADEYGMLGFSPWRAGERSNNNTLMLVYFFKDVESLNKFAHDDIHRKAWDWIVKTDHKHIGFFHESFCVPRQAYETIYVNFQPILMGSTSIKCADEEGGETYVQPVVSADTGPLKSQFGRMGRAFKEHGGS